MKKIIPFILLVSTIVFLAASPKKHAVKDWKIGVQMWTFNHFTFVEALNKVDSAGVKYIECYRNQKMGEGFGNETFGPDLSADSRAKLKELLKSKGIHIWALGVITPRTVDEWKKYFDLAKEFNLSYITAEPIKTQWNQVDSLAAIAGHPNIGSCADVGHWARSGLNPVECLKKLSGHIIGVHLKDIVQFNNPRADDTIVSKGVIDFPAIFAELKSQGFSGMMSIEHESNWYHNLPDVIETVKYYNEQVAKLK